MSKKHKRKHFNSGSTSFNMQAAGAQLGSGQFSNQPNGQKMNQADAQVAEYRIIKHDLLRVVILNALFLAAVLTLYYTNLHSQYLERFFGKILHF
jgi:hypothetical protein